MSFRFGTKAETLENLRRLVKRPHFCEQMFFSVDEWRTSRGAITERALAAFSVDELAVRSSTQREDGAEFSMAGAFLSLVGVPRDRDAFMGAVDEVVESYGGARGIDQVLVQPRLDAVAISGVVLTRDLETGAPYYVINYDDVSGRTDSVTGGAESKTVLVHRDRPEALHSARLRALVHAVSEIEETTGSDALDVEFCVTHSDEVYILQVRPLAASRNWGRVPDARVDSAIAGVRTAFRERISAPDGVAGDGVVFGQMPDWNPAEMIGSTPRPLAYSLYDTLITGDAWAEARARMGYRDMTGHALMTAFAGHPYIDVRLSLNSFLPAALDDALAHKLVTGQLARLAERRELHDRIEFGIAVPSLDFAFDERRSDLAEAGLSAAEIARFHAALSALTRTIVESGRESMRAAEAEIDRLPREQGKRGTDIAAIAELIEACRRDGVVPFAMLARHAFIGVAFLKSLVRRGVLGATEVDRFIGAVRTVAADFVGDMDALRDGALSREAFLERYGHLRPGTYDITSPRYDQEPDLYLGGQGHGAVPAAEFTLDSACRKAIAGQMTEIGLAMPVDGFLAYVTEAIRLRESAKFRFTRVVSDILEMIADWGAARGLSRADLSFLTIPEILGQDGADFAARIAAARDRYRSDRLVHLPHLISAVEDIDVVRLPLNEPTYITQRSVTAPALLLAAGQVADIDGKIVMIESADPGFDWIFSHKLAGLITKFGGANSHMAIRCAEFGVSAAIGCGERLFDILSRGRVVQLDCPAQAVRVVLAQCAPGDGGST